MSLINKMLKDLEKRKPPKDKSSGSGGYSTGGATPEGIAVGWRRYLHYWPWMVLIVVAVVALVYFLDLGAPKVVPPAPKPKVANVPKLLEPLHVNVLNVRWEQSTTGGLLTLKLSHLVHYQVKQVTPKQLTLTLFDTTMTPVVLPPVLPDDSLVSSMSVHKQGKASTLDITLKQPGYAKATEINKTKEPTLQLELALTPKIVKPQEAVSVPLTNEQRAARAYSKIPHLIADNRTHQAMRDLEAMIIQYPDFAQGYSALAILELQRGQNIEALATINTGLVHEPGDPELVFLKARLLLQDDEVRAALHLLNQYSPKFSTHLDYYALRAMAEQRLGHDHLAEVYYNRLLKINPKAAQWWLGLGIALQNQGKLRESQYAYQQALDTGELRPSLQAYVETQLRRE